MSSYFEKIWEEINNQQAWKKIQNMEIRPEEENIKEISMSQHRMKVEKKTSFYIQGLGPWGNPQNLSVWPFLLLCLVTNHLKEDGEPFQGCCPYGTTMFSSKTIISFHNKRKTHNNLKEKIWTA